MSIQVIDIRKAIIDDLPTLKEFEQQLIKAERLFDKDLKDGKTTYYDIEKLIEDEDSLLVVAVYNGELVGSGYAQIRKSKQYIKYDTYTYLGFMYVTPPYRGKGIIGEITEYLQNWSKDRGILNMKLEVFTENKVAIIAYEKAGFYKRIVEMRFNINDKKNHKAH